MTALLILMGLSLALFGALMWTLLRDRRALEVLETKALAFDAAVAEVIRERTFQPDPDDLAREHFSEEALAGYVQHLASPIYKWRDLARKVVSREAGRAEPLLVAALDTPAFAPATRHAWFDMSAWEFSVRTLAERGNASIAPRLASLLGHAEPQIRGAAAFALARVGRDAWIDPVQAALADESGYVRSEAMSGASTAAAEGGAEERFRALMFERIGSVACGEVSTEEAKAFARDLADAPRHLLGFGVERALAVLASPRALRAGNPFLTDVLDVLHECDARVGPAILSSIIQAAKSRPGEARWALTHAQALKVLVPNDRAAARAEAMDAMRSRNRLVRATGCAVAYELEGLPTPEDLAAFSREHPDGSLTNEQYHVLVADRVRALVRGSGVERALADGRSVAEARASLEAIGATRASGILGLLSMRLGVATPAGTDGARELNALKAELVRELDALDTTLFEYAAAHRAEILHGMPGYHAASHAIAG